MEGFSQPDFTNKYWMEGLSQPGFTNKYWMEGFSQPNSALSMVNQIQLYPMLWEFLNLQSKFIIHLEEN